MIHYICKAKMQLIKAICALKNHLNFDRKPRKEQTTVWTCSLARNQRDTLSFLRPKGTTLLEIYKFICDCVFDKLGKFLFTSSIPFGIS